LLIWENLLISKSCNYGLRAGIYLAIKEKDSIVSIKEISKNLNVPFHFLTKTLQQLTQQGILLSTKGPKGGVQLAKPAKNITLMEIVLAIDGAKIFETCILGLPGCGVLNPCPLHEEWSNAVGTMKKTFNNTTIASLADRVKNKNLRITSVNYPEFLDSQT
jgi:Rrf2 family transcriptional regulator, iron-sulfur cluster assembly transcription factor